jgi:hypothetical protein
VIYAVSDLHVDFRENMEWVWSLSSHRYLDDALIVAGDVSDNLQRLELTLVAMRERFAAVMFVPGNHELWVRNGNWTDSWEKFQHIQDLCHRLGILTEPTKFSSDSGPVWLVPLYSWYIRPQDGDGSLFAEKKAKILSRPCGLTTTLFAGQSEMTNGHWRTIDGVLYVSNCLGYPRERGSVLDDNPHAGLVKVY